jgi:hypothetical protein
LKSIPLVIMTWSNIYLLFIRWIRNWYRLTRIRCYSNAKISQKKRLWHRLTKKDSISTAMCAMNSAGSFVSFLFVSRSCIMLTVRTKLYFNIKDRQSLKQWCVIMRNMKLRTESVSSQWSLKHNFLFQPWAFHFIFNSN